MEELNYKIQKYSHKLRNAKNLKDGELYQRKVEHYRSLLQHGGEISDEDKQVIDSRPNSVKDIASQLEGNNQKEQVVEEEQTGIVEINVDEEDGEKNDKVVPQTKQSISYKFSDVTENDVPDKDIRDALNTQRTNLSKLLTKLQNSGPSGFNPVDLANITGATQKLIDYLTNLVGERNVLSDTAETVANALTELSERKPGEEGSNDQESIDKLAKILESVTNAGTVTDMKKISINDIQEPPLTEM